LTPKTTLSACARAAPKLSAAISTASAASALVKKLSPLRYEPVDLPGRASQMPQVEASATRPRFAIGKA
jgi:hypothetical protein